jgi:prolipoprotein diacylglyceryltransferase
MRPILFEWRGFRIHSYPVLLYLGFVLGITVGDYAANLAGLDPARVLVAMVLLTIPGLLGARVLFVATHWTIYRQNLRRARQRSDGGMAMQGGLLMAVAVSVPLLIALGIPFFAFWDVATFSMLCTLILGRLGCLLHGCCAGRPSDSFFAMNLPDDRGVWTRRAPAQILEAACAVLLLIVATAVSSARPFAGAIFLAVMAAYALFRVTFQQAREAQDWAGGFNVQGALSAAIGSAALAAWLIVWLGRS